MQSILKTTGILFGTALLAFNACAAVLVQDNFDSYAQGPLPTNNPALSPWIGHSGNPLTGIQVVADPTGSTPNALQVSQALTEDVHANLESIQNFADIIVTNSTVTTNGSVVTTNFTYNYAFSASNSVSTLYSKYTIYVTTVPPGGASGTSQTYFGHFYSSSGTFFGRVFLVTNGVATPGTFRVAVQNGGTALTNTVPIDLSAGTAYTIVTRYVLSTGSNTLWINPVNEADVNHVSPLDSVSTPNIMAYAFRQASAGEGVLDVDSLVTGTTFADVVPGSVNPPTFLTFPQDTNVFSGSSAVFKTLAAGDPTITYQWYYNTNTMLNNSVSISGANTNTLVLSNLGVGQSGTYSCVASNSAGTNVTRFAVLLVSPTPIPPTIDTNTTPSATTNVVGDTVTFTVSAHGLPAPAYQWKFVPSTNSLVTNIISGATSSTLTLVNVSSNSAGSYFCTITNNIGYLTTNSALASLTVNPPPVLSIAQLRSMVDNTYAPTNTTAVFTVQGTVTTWTNMTTSSSSSEFYMQDNTAGIAVFWSGAAASTNVPPAGAIVRVTGPLAAFSGLLEIEPVFTNTLHSVTVISTGNPLPAPQPLPFDPNVTGNMAQMKAMESTYFVASNVTLAAGSTFISGANEPITANTGAVLTDPMFNVSFTNSQGNTFTLFINGATDIPGKTKPAGPVTIYGVLGYFTAQGFEFTPSRYADVVSYIHVTNILANARVGDLPTNNYIEDVVRPGESLISYVSIGDPAGGIVTLAPTGTLPTGATWSGITSGQTATAVFHYTGNSADAGSDFPVALNVTSTAGSAFTETLNVYVPNSQEQQIAITEILAKPTTNTGSAFYNPLARSAAVNGIATNDQYIEIVNQSGTDLNTKFTLDTGTASSPVFSSFDGFGTSLMSSNSLIVYGGDGNPTTLPGLATPVFASRGLFLPTSGSGTLVLRNNNGNIIDRVVYSGDNLGTNGSLSRFPSWVGTFVPQAYVGTNAATPGLQYDGAPWNSPPQIPAGVANISITKNGTNLVLSFATTANRAATLWNASTVNGLYSVIYGESITGSTGAFTNTIVAPQQFYYITTQTNH